MSMYIAKLMYHRWEEEPISGVKEGLSGTFAIFFYGCNMRCVYCQNKIISHIDYSRIKNLDNSKRKIIFTPKELSVEIMNAKNSNIKSVSFITGALYVDEIVETIKILKENNFDLPIVYNSSGYETVYQIKKLDGLIDIFLPDFKYYDNTLGKKYSNVPNYIDVAKLCIDEMYRQVIKNKSKMIVRHLVLPSNTKNSINCLDYLYEKYSNDICYSIMSQYTPMKDLDTENFAELNRKLTKREYEKVVNHAINIGIENAFIQENDVADASFIPEFQGT